MNSPLEKHALDTTNIIPGTLDGGEVPDMAKAIKNDGVWPRFSIKPVLNKAKSDKEGRPIHDSVEWVDVIIAGDRNSKPSHKVTELDRFKWPNEYAAFKSGDKMPIQGTPLDQWNQIGVDQRADLISLGILTVDMLAGLSDEQVQSYGLGGMQLRESARAFIESSKNDAYPQQLAIELDTLKKDIKFRDDQIELLKASVAKMADNPDSTERTEQLEAMNKTLISANGTLEENNGLLKDKVIGLEDKLVTAEAAGNGAEEIADLKTKMEALSLELTNAKKDLSTAKGQITKLSKPAGKVEVSGDKSKKTDPKPGD